MGKPTNNRIVIGIAAKIGCGKSTLAKEIQKLRPLCRIESFGNAVKMEAALRYGFPLGWGHTAEGKARIISHPKLPRENMTIRDVLQWHGTDYRRKQFSESYWTDVMRDVMGIFPCTSFIIDDIRFPDEAEMVLSFPNHYLVQLYPYREWIPGPNAKHESETALNNYEHFDHVLGPNYGDLPAYAKSIVKGLKL